MNVFTMFLSTDEYEHLAEQVANAKLPVTLTHDVTEAGVSFCWMAGTMTRQSPLFCAAIIGGLDAKTLVWLAFPGKIVGSGFEGLWMFAERIQENEADPFEALRHLVTTDLKTMPYAAYLKTEHWEIVREGALERADRRCQLCNSPQSLHVHHRTYERRGGEFPGDVIVLCANCHAKFHDKLPRAKS